MRITNKMMSDQVIFNLQRSLNRYLDLQTDMSSGKRINKPSDDPVGTMRDLDYRTQLSRIDQYQANIDQGMNWLDSYDSILADVNDMLSEAKELGVSMASDNYDASQRTAAANEIQAIFDRVVQLADSQIGGRQMFSGYKTKTTPFTVYNHGVTYGGDFGKILYEIEASSREAVNLSGAETFLRSFGPLGADSDFNIGVSVGTQLTALNDGAGVDLASGTFTITDNNLVGVSTTVDLTAAPPVTTLGEAITRINDSLVAAGMDGTVTVGLSDEGNSLRFTTTRTGLVSSATRIEKLRGGNGIDLSSGRIQVSNGSGIDVTVDFSGAQTLGDVISVFNSAMTANGVNNVAMAVNAAGTGLVIDDTNGTPLDLTISNFSDDDSTAALLGIEGFVGASLSGEPLDPMVSLTVTETTGTTAADLGITGDISGDKSGEDLDPRLSVDDAIADLRNGVGFDGNRFTIWQGERSLTIDLTDPAIVTVQDLIDRINNTGLDITASINASGKGLQIENNDPTRSLVIQDLDGGRATKQMGLYGSSDMMGSLMTMIDALKNDDAEAVGLLLANLDEAMAQAQELRAGVGTRTMLFETSQSRLTKLNLSFTKLLSSVEDADLTQVLTDLATLETSYQAALSAAGKIIQPSLLDFLS